MRTTILFAVLLAVGGCAAHSAMTCVPVPEYTKPEQTQAANELAGLPADDYMLPRMIGDYRVMRAQARRCQ